MTAPTIRSIDCHMHTPLCGHCIGEPESFVREAAAKDIDLITFTCHIPMLEEDFGQRGIRMTFEELFVYTEMVERARQCGEDLGVRVLCGIEAEIFPDEDIMQRMDETLATYPFDFVLGSLHAGLPSFRAWCAEQGYVSDADIVEAYFNSLTQAIPTQRYDSLSHPDVVRLYGVIRQFEPEKHEPTIRRFLQTAADYDQCLEVNTSGLIKGDYVVHPDPLILDWAAQIGNRFTLGSDAHHPESVGQKFDEVLPLLKSKGIDRLHYFIKRERYPLTIHA